MRRNQLRPRGWAAYVADDQADGGDGASGLSHQRFTKHDWKGAFFFAMAVAVGLTPEMLPMIVSVCLSKGALAMSRRKVIVKRLNAIQNFGAWTYCAPTKQARSPKTASSFSGIVTLRGGKRMKCFWMLSDQPLSDRA